MTVTIHREALHVQPPPVETPLVSIALCTYNGAKFLRQQLDSLFSQTHTNFEIIAIDDCSTDETLSILNEYAQHDLRMQVHANHINRGLKKNFEIAFQKCTGVFVAPCDQDDIWMPGKLTALINAIGVHAMSYCDSELVAESGQSLQVLASHHVAMLSTDDPSMFVFNNCVSGHAMLLRRAVMTTALPIPDEFFHDWWFAACAASIGGIVCFAQPLVKYRQHASSITNMRRDRVHRKINTKGHRLHALRMTERRIHLLSKLSGPHQSLLIRLHQLWTRRELQWLSWSLAWFMLRYGRLFYATRKQTSLLFLIRRASYFLWGLRFKQFTNSHAYNEEDSSVDTVQ